MGSPDRPSKQEAFLALLREGWTSLHLDARRAGVVVPAHLKNEPHLVLQYGHDLPIPIPDLCVDENGVSATLSFARVFWSTVVPWSAVYVVASDDGRGVLYHEDIPGDVSVIQGNPAEADAGPGGVGLDRPLPDGPTVTAAATAAVSSTPTPTRSLRAVPLGVTMESFGSASLPEDGAADPLLPGRRRRRPQLRLVK